MAQRVTAGYLTIDLEMIAQGVLALKLDLDFFCCAALPVWVGVENGAKAAHSEK